MPERQGVPSWVWVGCGCLAALGAIFLLLVALGVWGLSKATELADELADPDERAGKAREVLGAHEIPEGYYTVLALSLPFLLDVAILSDVPPDKTGRPPEMGRRGFIYVSAVRFGRRDREIRDFFEGTTGDVRVLDQQDIDVDLDERVASGKLTREEDELLWVSHRGTIDARDSGSSREGLVTLFLLECDSDSRRRLGLWYGPDPSPGTPAPELDLTGTVADPRALEKFLEPIRPCP